MISLYFNHPQVHYFLQQYTTDTAPKHDRFVSNPETEYPKDSDQDLDSFEVSLSHCLSSSTLSVDTQRVPPLFGYTALSIYSIVPPTARSALRLA